MDWKKAGEQLFQDLQQRWNEFSEGFFDKDRRGELVLDLPGVEWRLHRPEPASPEFREAVEALRSQNDAGPLIDYLKSDSPLEES